jgi:hypothetical protein
MEWFQFGLSRCGLLAAAGVPPAKLCPGLPIQDSDGELKSLWTVSLFFKKRQEPLIVKLASDAAGVKSPRTKLGSL